VASPDDVARALLIKKADGYFWGLIWSTVILLFGAIMEEVHPLSRLPTHNVNARTHLRTPRRGVLRSKKAYGILAVVFVVGGIAGEGIFEYLGAKAETAVRNFDNAIAVKAEGEAGDAARSAHDAKQDEIQLGEDTKAAEAVLATAQKNAENAEHDLDAYLAQLRTPRDIVMGGRDEDQDERAKRFAEIDKYRETTVIIQSIPEWEPQQYARHLSAALNQHGWRAPIMTSEQTHIPYEVMDEGVIVATLEPYGKSKAYVEATALVNLLDLDLGPPYGPEYFGVHWVQPGMASFTHWGFVYPKDGVLILVGTRPSFHADAIHRHAKAQ
jgi:hypothetical protein